MINSISQQDNITRVVSTPLSHQELLLLVK